MLVGIRCYQSPKYVIEHIYYSTLCNICLCVWLFSGFVNARSWLADVREHADPQLTCILVGNKLDLCSDGSSEGAATGGKRKREVSVEEAELWAKEENLLFVEASAKSGENVEAAFERATRDILSKVHRGVFDDDRVSARSCTLWHARQSLHRDRASRSGGGGADVMLMRCLLLTVPAMHLRMIYFSRPVSSCRSHPGAEWRWRTLKRERAAAHEGVGSACCCWVGSVSLFVAIRKTLGRYCMYVF